MALGSVKEKYEKYIPQESNFYRDHYHQIFWGMMILIVLSGVSVGVVLYEILHRPLPVFNAMQPNGDRFLLTPFQEPNLLPDTIIRWASQAATTAYTFDFNNYNEQLSTARPYFTEAGWQDYLSAVQPLIANIRTNRIFVNSVVSGTPVIANQGDLPSKGYTWRVQIPFLVTYILAQGPVYRNYFVVVTIVKVPTSTNPQGIGIDQFVMR